MIRKESDARSSPRKQDAKVIVVVAGQLGFRTIEM